MKIIKLSTLIFCFVFTGKAIAQGSKGNMPDYLKSSKSKKNRPSEFEKEVAEVDPFIKNNIPLDTKSGLKDSSDNFKEFHPMSDKDMEDIFSSINENPIKNDRNNQIRPSLIDQISSQDDEIRVSKGSGKRLIVGQSHNNEGQESPSPSLINEVFQDPDDENIGMDKIPEERFAYEDEKGSDMGHPVAITEKREEQQLDPGSQQQRTPSNYEQRDTVFKSGMHTFSKNCILYSQPETSSEPWKVIKLGKELWLDKFNDQWYKAYKSDNDPVFLQADCLN